MKKNILIVVCMIFIFLLSCEKKAIIYTEEDFFNAIRQNKIDIVQACLDQGMSVETKFSSGTVLNLAVRRGQLEIVELLIEQGADINKTRILTDPYQDPEMIQLLLENGADPNNNIGTKSSLLMYHIVGVPLNFASKRPGNPEYERTLKVVELLLQYGADPNYFSEETGESPLNVALNYDMREVVDLLLQYGAKPRSEAVPINFDYDPLNFREWDEDYGVVWQSDLLLFAYNGYTDLLMPYIESGEISPDDATPLGYDYYYYAVAGGHSDTIMALLPYLDDVNSKRYNSRSYSRMSLLCLAGLNDHIETMRVLLENGASPDLIVIDKFNGAEKTMSFEVSTQGLWAITDYERGRRYPEYRVTKKVVQ